jgi:hypothetical protein
LLHLNLPPNKKKQTSLRRILLSWHNKGLRLRIIQAIEVCSTNTQTILVEKRNKETVTQKLNNLFDLLERRCDLNKICGNSSKFGAQTDKFTITKSGQNYLSFLKRNNSPTYGNSTSSNLDENPPQGKQKLQQTIVTDTYTLQTAKSTISPLYKKSLTNTVQFKDQCPKLSGLLNFDLVSLVYRQLLIRLYSSTVLPSVVMVVNRHVVGTVFCALSHGNKWSNGSIKILKVTAI